MSKREAGILLADIRAAIDKIGRYIGGLDRQTFLADDEIAVVRNLEIIGQAVKRLPAELIWNILKTALPEFSRQVREIE